MNRIQADENGRSSKRHVPILTYHSIDTSGSIISTTPDVFRRQMEFLDSAGYQTLSLGELISTWSSNGTVSPMTIVLTFDDGFQNFYTEAFPILQEFRFTATVFLVTDHCGKFNDWSGNPATLPRSEMLSWGSVEELSRFGIEFGGHTKTHPDLTKLAEKDALAEMADSRKTLEDRLGKESRTFAYPYGRHNGQVRRIAKRLFTASCSTDLGKVNSDSDVCTLDRIDTYYLSNLRVFEALPYRTFDGYLKVRQVMRRLRSSFDRS
jgi:peptidoglycan/xylan/chitin deacetylase (PgdA/CDA1 family)